MATYAWMKPHRNIHSIAQSVHDLLRVLEPDDNGNYLYRGQYGVFGDITRQIPSIHRACRNADEAKRVYRQCHLKVAWLFNQIRPESIDKRLNWLCIFLGDVDKTIHPISVLARSQHYGIPTDLLDLTNLLPAAMFATQEWMTIKGALRYPTGTVFPVKGHEVGFIYRYRIDGLKSMAAEIGNLATGKFGARPLIQEGKVIQILYKQDIDFFENDVFEVFPFFHQKQPFKYKRPDKVPFLETDDHTQALIAQALHKACPSGLAMRDFVIPPLHFFPAPSGNPVNMQGMLLLGSGNYRDLDPFLAIGEIIEDGIPSDLTQHELYARNMFGSYFGRSLDIAKATEEAYKKHGLPWNR